MKLSVVIATRNRAHTIAGCLDSVAKSFAHASLSDAEIVIIDNGSTDNTAEVIKNWAGTNTVTVQTLFEPHPGKSAALNRGIRAARGDLLFFTDDDCRLSLNHTAELLRYDSEDKGLTLRGGRVELGDPTDLPLTIQTNTERLRWQRDAVRPAHLGGGVIPGCNMAMRRAVFEQVGPFDEHLGPGKSIPAGEDADYVYRCFLGGVVVEYVPDMTVVHLHGRKSREAGLQLVKQYIIGTGALYAKFRFRHPNLREKFSPSRATSRAAAPTVSSDKIDISRPAKLLYAAWGALRYCAEAQRPKHRE